MDSLAAGAFADEVVRGLKGSPSTQEKESLLGQLRQGMALYPDHLDAYGDPLFRKELVRQLLQAGNFPEAAALIGPEDSAWQHILFARALAAQGRSAESRDRWQEVLRLKPGHPEAQRALGGPASAKVTMPRPDAPLLPRMSEAERSLFGKWLEGVGSFLEFGAGGSTAFAARAGVQHICSVESDLKWLQMLADRPELRGIRFEQVYIDVGPVGHFGTPTDPARARDWPAYYTKVWERVTAPPDLVLVDGRFRVACTLATLLHCPAETPIIIHDFWNRPHYHLVLKYLDSVETADTLGVFRAKADISFRDLAKDLMKYALTVG